MIVAFRISVDECQKQRFTEEQIYTEFENDNVKIKRKLLIRKSDGAVMGEVLKKKNYSREEVIKKIHDVLEATGEKIGAKMMGIGTEHAYIEFKGKDLNKWIEENIL